MNACPNIAGREIKRRKNFTYFGLFITLLTIALIVYQQYEGLLRALVFIPSMSMMIPLLEVKSKTCIVNAFLGLKNMGHKYEKEKNEDFLKEQRKESLKLVVKGIFLSSLITILMMII